jgi:hypothetical protein
MRKGKRSRSKTRESSAQTSARQRRINRLFRSVLRPRDLTPKQLAAKDRALEALGKMRREGWSFRKATQWAHVDRRTARKFLGPALLGPRGNGGQLRAAKGDNITRNLLFAGADGSLNYKPVRGSKAATELSNYFKELKDALRTRKLIEFEARWKGLKIGGREVLADAAKIQQLAEAGLLKFETLYKQARGGGI